ncbi:LysR family transcriptional regulator [Paracoccus pacificus]|uniref:LysR family transcriptional regulator n=1 Tax=Paracoccus pacificus TaxID=1463598 RepID=A0ABW4R626_9RHOB
MIKLEMLRVFRTVAEHGSLAGASAALGRTPSAVSMMLAQLEENIGAPLFETDRKNRLTKLGEGVLTEAVRATDVFSSSSETIRRLTNSIAGIVRVAAVPSVTITLLPGAIAAFRSIRPEVRLEISDVDSASVRRRIRLDEADIGIVSAGADDPGEGVTILRDRLGIVHRLNGPIGHALASGAEASWRLLGLEPLIVNPLCRLVDSDWLAGLQEKSNLEARNTTALLSFVRDGLGATVLPESAIAHMSDRLGVAVASDPVAIRELRMIRNPDRRPSPAAQEFWDALAAMGTHAPDVPPPT